MKVALIGRPNVGKSALFNAFTHSRDVLVYNRPGITRDVVEGTRSDLTFFDTAGLDTNGKLSKESTELALITARGADAVLFVVDAKSGIHPMDLEWAKKIRSMKNKGKIILLANKNDTKASAANLHDFYKLGFGAPIPVSAEHNLGLSDVLNEIKTIQRGAVHTEAAAQRQGLPPKIVIMGVPNVGKSTLINRLAGIKRVLVGDESGTTRDAVKINTHFLGRDMVMIDTAGLRKKSHIDDGVETLASLKALDTMKNADAAILVLDATKNVDKQSAQIAERIFNAGKILCVALNKWDLVPTVEQDEKLMSLKHAFTNSLRQIIKPLILPISASKGSGVKNMMKRLYELIDKSRARAPTSLINRIVEKLVMEKQPPMSRLKRPMKIKFSSQTGSAPNTITINVGGASDIPDAYTRYLRRGLALALGWESLPVLVQYSKDENPFDKNRKDKL